MQRWRFFCQVSMPIPLRQKLKRISKVVRLDNALPSNDKGWIVWWYCGIYKNHNANSQPNALVAFRSLLNDGNLSDEVIHRRMPLTALGQVRVGTVWRERLCHAEVILDSEKFTVDFTKPSWKLTSFHQASEDGSPPPYQHSIYPLAYPKDQNWLLEFTLPTGGRLIVPCLEFFTRCYGRSAELRRVLATYSWKACLEQRLYAPLDEPEESDNGKWKVKLRKRLVNGDVVLLAHAKYQPYTEKAVKSIYAQIEAFHDPAGKRPAFIKVAPWFRGPAELKAKGIWFDEVDGGRSFLALQIVGCSQPEGPQILRGRENANTANQLSDYDESGRAWAGAPERTLIKPPEIVDLTGDVEPDPHAISVEIEDPDFEELGEPRVIISMRNDRAKGTSGSKVKGADASAFSSGEPHGSGQGVGYASIYAKTVMESQGMLRDMWNAMLFLKKELPSQIQSVEWFTFNEGYRGEAEPKLIGLQPFDETDEVDGTTRKWPYMDITTLQEIRGILVARIVALGMPIHIVEIQRRPQKKKDKNGDTENAEEHFKGLVFLLDDQDNLKEWLQQFLSEVRYVKGVVQKVASRCPGRAATFNHSAASGDQVLCKAAVVNALEKMGIDILKHPHKSEPT